MSAVIESDYTRGIGNPPDSYSEPRFMSPPHPHRWSSWGQSAELLCANTRIHGGRVNELRHWQRVVLDRALECDKDGQLLWRTVVVSAPRQVGKSVLERVVCFWRIHQSSLFNQTQDIVHVAHKEVTALEVWRPVARHMQMTYPQRTVDRQRGREKIELPDGSRWMIQAATDGAAVGYALTMVLVDEAWKIGRSVVDAALRPTLAESNSPQLWLVSTAGTAGSDLMKSYRDLAMSGSQHVCLIEWSAETDHASSLADERLWKSASPYWDERRAEHVAEAFNTSEEWDFRQQYLNQWVPTVVAPFIDANLVDDCVTYDPMPDGPVSFGVDIATDRTHACIVACSDKTLEVIDAGDGTSWVFGRVRELAERWNPPAIGIDAGSPAQTIADQLSVTEFAGQVVTFNGRDIASASGRLFDLLQAKAIRIRSHPSLIDALLAGRKRMYGQSWTFARDTGTVSGVPLVAATLALGASERLGEPVETSAIW